ncbi:Acg family FMN-binding oxidoreductase [Kitasatospora mediocidica]|uniref:Acg family FMN-binding oxidoreductase n=1 Tax=Kitasatospora mediocidica TaxID=58352 RepID=UPI00068ECAE2|nr:hypothetical protein [Kitasatospora mediocidica]
MNEPILDDPTLTAQELRSLAAAGTAAPSLLNTQPWRFRAYSGTHTLRVYADPQRALPRTDPDGRALHLSVGTAVFNLRVAAAHLGLEPSVRLLPEASDPHLCAELDLSRTAETPNPDPDQGPDLYAAIEQRHSSRLPFADRDVPETVLGELRAAARAEGAVLSVQDEDGVRRVMALTEDAERRTADDPVREAESRAWLRSREPASDGIPLSQLGPPDSEARLPMRSYTGRPPAVSVPPARFEALPHLALLSTHADHPSDWLHAGQALERVWLLATVHGVRISVMHQALEWPQTRWELRDPNEGPGFTQTVLRLGFGPAGPAAPRRPVAEVLEVVGAPAAA